MATNSLSLPNLEESRNNVTFEDIATEIEITYQHSGNPAAKDLFEQLTQKSVITPQDLAATPFFFSGTPGVVMFDYDGDDDLDLYVTNGPGTSNSLYSNQWQETGQLTFVDVAEQAGVTATEQHSSGVSYGDIDNDGDHDLLVLGVGQPNRLFENQGDGTFIDITEQSGISGDNKSSSSASMGDVNGDGLLDIVIANTFSNWADQSPLFTVPFDRNEHNQLFLNTGDNNFVDASTTSGIQNLTGFPEEEAGSASITWTIAMVDYDLDGDVDIIHGDDQGTIPPAELGGVDRGLLHVLQNDGTGNFTDVNVELNLNIPGAWMGLSFGDFNADGIMDIFGSNLGDYTGLPPGEGRPSMFPYEVPRGLMSSQWFLGQEDGTFQAPGVGDLIATPFGWGTSAPDYDNDGDTDIIFYGGLEAGLVIDASNPGAILQNDGTGNFAYDANALANTASHTFRNDKGVAVGDLNQDGFVDIVSVSDFNVPETSPVERYPVDSGSPFDETGVFIPVFNPVGNPEDMTFQWSGVEPQPGTVAVELNSADNSNNWVEVQLMGTAGITTNSRVNNDGIGSVVSFTPEDGQTVMQPILGGSSFLSQHSLAANFGLGAEESGTIEVLWPGGVRNRLYDVEKFERIVFPEIPVSFDDHFDSFEDYYTQVNEAVSELVASEVLTFSEGERYLSSAVRAFLETQAGTDTSDIILEDEVFDTAIANQDFDGNRDILLAGTENVVGTSLEEMENNDIFGTGSGELLESNNDSFFEDFAGDFSAHPKEWVDPIHTEIAAIGNDESFIQAFDAFYSSDDNDFLNSRLDSENYSFGQSDIAPVV